jgi:hypothetical protein
LINRAFSFPKKERSIFSEYTKIGGRGGVFLLSAPWQCDNWLALPARKILGVGICPRGIARLPRQNSRAGTSRNAHDFILLLFGVKKSACMLQALVILKKIDKNIIIPDEK